MSDTTSGNTVTITNTMVAVEDQIRALVRLMKEQGISRLAYSYGTLKYELELPRLAVPLFVEQPIAETVKALRDTAKEDTCSCGHSIAVEHNEFGCLQGCSVSLCASTDAAPGEPRPN